MGFILSRSNFTDNAVIYSGNGGRNGSIQKRLVFSVIILFVFALFYTWIEQAEARRMGGGRSFGSSPSYQRSAPSPTSPQKSPSQTQPSPQSPATPAAAPRPFGGMLGGLLMGGLIGSLLFGGMHGSGHRGFWILSSSAGFSFSFSRFLKARRMATQGAGQTSFSTGLGLSRNLGFSQPRTRICSGSAAPGCGRGS